MREGLWTIADLVERIEDGGAEVADVSVTRTDGDEGLDVDISVDLPSEPWGTTAGHDRGDGRFRGGITAAPPAESRGTTAPLPDTDFGPRAATVGTTLGGAHGAAASAPTDGNDAGTPDNAARSSSHDESIACRVEGCEETFETEHGMKIHATKAHQSPDGSAPSPHRDPERLREVYEEYDTFEEMTAALGVDVTPQTVRRSMMALDVHDPGDAVGGGADESPTPDAEGDTASDADDGQPRIDEDVAPDHGTVQAVLPDEVDAEVFVTAIRDASTIFQVQRALGMQREEVQNLLAELGLLELVHGRVATEAERDLDRAEIERRILAGTDPEPADSGLDDADLDDGGGTVEAD